MKIGIITLPLHTNYGGVLQAYALQSVLRGMGHDAIQLQLEEVVPIPKGFRGFCIRSKRRLKQILGQNVEVDREGRICKELPIVGAEMFRFIKERMSVRYYSSFSQVTVSEFDAFVVGSDQIWRPVYNHSLTDAFLEFAQGASVKRVAYAASFGVGTCEYPESLRHRCGELLSAFDAVSVREEAGVDLCWKMFGIEAVCMCDPTMLLTADDYLKFVSKTSNPKVFAYILDKGGDSLSVLTEVAGLNQTEVEIFNSVDPRGLGPIEDRVQPSIEDWIGGIAQAKFVVTDSFHATVFSILFHRPFIAVSNKGRGMSRLESLLKQFGLEDRLIILGADKVSSLDAVVSKEICWEPVDACLDTLRSTAFDFLKRALS